MKNLFDFSMDNDKGSKKDNKRKIVGATVINNEVMSDPLFKKVQGLKKILFKYTNKTYLSKAEMKKD